MENKYTVLTLVCIFLCIFFTCFFPLAAQNNVSSIPEPETQLIENSKKNYFIKETDEGITFIQRLSWEAIDDILGFEFELEEQDQRAKTWKQIDKQTVQTNYVDKSLPAGNYRFRVRAINLLEQKEEPSDYRNFNILLAHQPELASVSPQPIIFEEMKDHTLTITGKNFHKNTSFTFTDQTRGLVLPGKIVKLNEAGTNCTVAFEFNKAHMGTYTIAATDPSQLSDTKSDIVFRLEKPFDVYFSGGYAFNALAGNRVLKQYFNTDVASLGGGIRLTVVPIKRYYGNFGFNFTGLGTFLQYKKNNIYTLKTYILFSQFNAAYFLPIIKHRLTFDVHAGIGTMFLFGTQFVYKRFSSPKTWYWGMTVNAGSALYIYIYSRFYVEINLDHIIPIRAGLGFPKYIIQPQVAIGWEF